MQRLRVKDIHVLENRQEMTDLRIYNLELYRLRRKKELVAYTQKMNAKSIPIIELLIMNQIERFEILREEEDKFKELKEQYKNATPIAIEKLQKITDPRIMYDQAYAIKVEEYTTFLRELQKYGDNFLNEFMAYIEFHESALQLYKQQTNELYIQLGFATNALYAKEIAEKQQNLEQQEHLKKGIEDEQEHEKYKILQQNEEEEEEEEEILNKITKFMSELNQHIS